MLCSRRQSLEVSFSCPEPEGPGGVVHSFARYTFVVELWDFRGPFWSDLAECPIDSRCVLRV